MQLNIFINKKCNWCGKMVGCNPRNPYLWNGFRDAGNNMLICFGCKRDYYANNKIKTQQQQH